MSVIHSVRAERLVLQEVAIQRLGPVMQANAPRYFVRLRSTASALMSGLRRAFLVECCDVIPLNPQMTSLAAGGLIRNSETTFPLVLLSILIKDAANTASKRQGQFKFTITTPRHRREDELDSPDARYDRNPQPQEHRMFAV